MRLFRQVPVPIHVLNNWHISARSACTLPMVLTNVLELLRQLHCRSTRVQRRGRVRSRKDGRVRKPSGDTLRVNLLRVRPQRSRFCRMRLMCRPEASSRVNNCVPMTFTLGVVVIGWAWLGRNGAIHSKFRGHRHVQMYYDGSRCMLVHIWHTRFIYSRVADCCVTVRCTNVVMEIP